MLKFLPVFLLVIMTSVNPIAAQETPPAVAADDPVLKVFEPRQFSDSSGVVLNYRLMKPIDFDSEKRYPLVVFLHGAGERGSDNTSQLKHGAKEFAKEENRKKYPAYVLAPQCPKGMKWVEVDWSQPTSKMPETPSQSMVLLKNLVDTMCANSNVDASRVYITGLSMGGYGTWDAISRYENVFAAAAPICGGGDPKFVSRFAKLPLWCFHGSDDPAVPVGRSREMIDALKAFGASPRYTEYEGVKHDSWTETYKNPEFFGWLFDQKMADADYSANPQEDLK
jgi:predicted peptidase